MSKKIQCFYNCNYNHGACDGQSKFAWGFSYFELTGDDAKPLKQQLIESAKLNESEVFNLNLTSFTPFPDELFDSKDNEDDE